MSEYPVDFWVMDVPDEADFPRVERVASAIFGDAFEWGGPMTGNPTKGVVRQVHADQAEQAAKVLGAVGARTLVDEDAYDDPGQWLSSITPEENRQDTFAMVAQYLDAQRRHEAGNLRITLQVSGEGMIRRLAHRWEPWSERPPFKVWDEIV